MNRKNVSYAGCTLCLWAFWGLLTLTPGKAAAQDFDFERLEQKAHNFTVIIDMKLELSFGIHTSDQQERYLGTIVTEDGLVLFNGMALGENVLAAFSPFAVKTTPTKIEVTTLDEKKYDAEYLGVDRFTQIGFIKIVGDENERFTPIRFLAGKRFKVGEWLTLYMLLPEFVNPPLAADVGMVSLVVESPELFPLTVGFSSLQMTSVLFDEDLEPVGVLGALLNPSHADAGGMLESFSQFGIPLLGVVVGERLEKLIAEPPMKGQPDRGWLGITLQALTPEMAQFWGLDVSGGIIINDIVSNSPAEKAGLAVGDIIYEVNGGQVAIDKDENLPIFQRLIAELGPGASLELTVIRRDDFAADTLKLFAALEKAPLAATEAPTYEVEFLEFEVRDLVFADYLFHNLKPETFSGVVVAELKRGGLANVGGLRLGDIIQSIVNVPVTSIEEVSAIMESVEFEKPREVIFFVWRNNKTLFVNVKTDWD